MTNPANHEPAPDGAYGRSSAQWTALLVSSLIVLTVLGLVIYDILVVGTAPPVIEVHPVLEEVRVEAGFYYLPVTLMNTGARTAQDVTASVTLQPAAGEPESASITIRFLAPGERDNGVILFKNDPREGSLSISTSFVRPY